MKIRQFQVDAFASKVFQGNPAAVCPLDHWLDDGVLQSIAEENNLSETAFFVPTSEGYTLRWFTPVKEIDLCGHATLAAAHVLFQHLNYEQPRITFATRSGALIVERAAEGLRMEFPASVPRPCATPPLLVQALGVNPSEVWVADDYIAVFGDEAAVRGLTPDQHLLALLDLRGVCVTAPGVKVDFVSRFFAPHYGIAEDPVTGSAHCELAPYWAAKLGKSSLHARQLSKRGGDVRCEVEGDRVILIGNAVTFLQGEIHF
ncbi:MAG: PhzF family phenazine biosynthesis protein [Gammaproteobacteria bacterium]|nr:PhzF family phenazine biosynthesis protein [Gammaproteobacteria bacterium]